LLGLNKWTRSSGALYSTSIKALAIVGALIYVRYKTTQSAANALMASVIPPSWIQKADESLGKLIIFMQTMFHIGRKKLNLGIPKAESVLDHYAGEKMDVPIHPISPMIEKDLKFLGKSTNRPQVAGMVHGFMVPFYEEAWKRSPYRNFCLCVLEAIGLSFSAKIPFWLAVLEKTVTHFGIQYIGGNYLGAVSCHALWNTVVGFSYPGHETLAPIRIGSMMAWCSTIPSLIMRPSLIVSQMILALVAREYTLRRTFQMLPTNLNVELNADLSSTIKATTPWYYWVGLIVLKAVFALYERYSMKNDPLWTDFKKRYSAGAHPASFQKEGVCALTLFENTLPDEVEAPLKPVDLPDIPKDWPTNELVPKQAMFILIGTQAMMVRPAGSELFAYCLQTRWFCPAPSDACNIPDKMGITCSFRMGKQDCRLRIAWEKAFLIFRDAYPGRLPDPLKMEKTYEEWVEHFNGAMKKERARYALKRNDDGLEPVAKITSHMKADEVICRRIDGSVKPRPIMGVHPSIQCAVGVPVQKAMVTLKANVGVEVIWKVGKYECILLVGSGLKSSELDEWLHRSLEFVLSRQFAVAAVFAGDDLFFFETYKGKLRVGESDFTKFDRTEGVHAVQFELRVLKVLGMNSRKVKLIQKTFGQPCVIELTKEQYRCTIQPPLQRPTGGPETSLGNTVVNIGSFLLGIEDASKSDRPISEVLGAAHVKCGLISKLQLFKGMHAYPTFLKGWWMPTKGVYPYRWLPLPSQIIKAGKIFTDPRSVHKHEKDPLTAFKMMARGMALGYGSIPYRYPILGALLENYVSQADKGLVTSDMITDREFKITVDYEGADQLDVGGCYLAMAARYGIDEHVLKYVDSLIRSAPFPGFISHPVFSVLMQVDYGDPAETEDVQPFDRLETDQGTSV
jgi:hypothetical protein